jgi:PKD repeat protein
MTEGGAVPGAEHVGITTDADPDSGGAPLTVKFTAEVEGGPAGLRYRWEFGDHTPAARQLLAEHTYQQPGEYTATFWVTGPGIEQSEDVDIEVKEEGIDFDIETDSDVGAAPLTVEFTARLDEDLPGPFYFAWDFGDGGRDVSNPTNHTYRKPGEYTATVTVTNAQGQRATRDAQIQVDAPDDAAE